jgi:hypothetical protein
MIVSATLAIVLATVIVIRLLTPPDPEYAGRPLSFWLQGYDWTVSGPSTVVVKGVPGFPVQRGREAADTAVKALGTNAVPRLLSMLQERDSPLMTNLVRWAGAHLHGAFHYASAQEKAQEAFFALGALGQEGKTPVQELIGIYDGCPWVSRRAILQVLGGLGSRPQAKEAVPLFVRELTNKDETIRCDAIFALGDVRPKPDIAVPAFIRELDDYSLKAEAYAAAALSEFSLTTLLNDKPLKVSKSPPKTIWPFD